MHPTTCTIYPRRQASRPIRSAALALQRSSRAATSSRSSPVPGKLNKALAEAAAGNVEVSNAFKALGINVLDSVGNTKLADVALAEIADKFAKLADGPEKVALAIKLFGKAGADMIPILNEGGASLLANVEYFKRYSGVTLETAAAADKFNDTLAKVHLLQQAFAKNLAAELLPILQTLANRFVDAKEQGDGFAGIAKKIAGALSGIAEVASFVVESLSAMSARLDGLIQKAGVLKDATPLPTGNATLDLFNQARAFTSADVKSQFEQINKIQDEGVAAAQKRHDRLVASLNFSVDPADAGHEGHGHELKKPPAARLPAVGAADNAAAELKKTLEGEIKNIEAFGRLQSQAFSFANAALDGVFAEGNLSLSAYFDEQNRLRDAQATARQGQIDKEIALERKFANDPRAKPTDRIGALEKIKELETERAGLVLKNAQDAVLASQRETAANKALQDSFTSINAQVLELGENFAAAAAIKFDLQNESITNTLTANLKSSNAAIRDQAAAALQAQGALRAAAIAQGAFQKASLDAGRTLDALSNAEERVAIAQQTGAIGSLQALSKVGDERLKAIAILERQVALEEAEAFRSGDKTLIANAEAAAPGARQAESIGRSARGIAEQGFRRRFQFGTRRFRDRHEERLRSVPVVRQVGAERHPEARHQEHHGVDLRRLGGRWRVHLRSVQGAERRRPDRWPEERHRHRIVRLCCWRGRGRNRDRCARCRDRRGECQYGLVRCADGLRRGFGGGFRCCRPGCVNARDRCRFRFRSAGSDGRHFHGIVRRRPRHRLCGSGRHLRRPRRGRVRDRRAVLHRWRARPGGASHG
jgi:hypothetical protein